MLFTELRFVFFFALVFVVYWALKGNRGRKNWLLVCSYAFYAGWNWRFLGLIVLSTLIDYVCGLQMSKHTERARRKPWLLLSLISNLGLLGFFKYYNWFIDSAAVFLDWLGVGASMGTLEIILPVGISFYTFQTISYTIDLYRDQMEPVEDFWDFALFVAFFPQLVAGPIVRAVTFLPQLQVARRFADVDWRACATQFLFGFIKKAVVADTLARFVDQVYGQHMGDASQVLLTGDPALWDGPSLWLGLMMYSVQLYCDFSGYTDMAIATAGMLGYSLPINFNFPLFSNSVTHTWQRWHISVSNWFRDYLYIPMGGNRASPARIYFNLVTVFVLCGLWHGARWNFIVFGLYTGFFMILERRFGLKGTDRTSFVRWAYALAVWLIGLVLFRTVTMGTAWSYWSGMFGFGADQTTLSLDPRWWWAIAAFWLVHLFMWRRWLHPLAARLPDWSVSVAIGAGFALALPLAASDYEPFIYFQW